MHINLNAMGTRMKRRRKELKQKVKEKFCNTWNIYNIKRRKVL